MLRNPVVSRQILRLSVLTHRDQGETADEVWAEDIERTLRRDAGSESHLVRIVDAWVQGNRFRPTPSELHAMAYAVPSMQISERPDVKCSACGGTGYAQAWELVTYEGGEDYAHKSVQQIHDAKVAARLAREVDGKKQAVYSGVVRCRECGYGRALAMAEQSRRDAA